MKAITVIWGLISLSAIMLVEGHNLDERKRVLKGKIGCLKAMMQDSRELFSLQVQFGHWMDGAHELVEKAEYFLGQEVRGWRSLVIGLKMRWDVDRLVDALEKHEKKVDVLIRHHAMSEQSLIRGYVLPVKAVVGEVASNTLKQLELLLEDDRVGRIVIHGVKGVGKTFLMKHLHNTAVRWVERFDRVFWVTFPDQITIKHVQEAVAAAVDCDLTSNDDLNVRARKLSDKLGDLDSFALFLDGIPTGVDFSLDQVGIPVPTEGSKCKCKLVLTSNSPLDSRVLDRFEAIKVDSLPQEEAYQLFMNEANIGNGSVSYLDGMLRLFANRCFGIPRMIVNIAAPMCGIDDPREWRHALYELGSNTYCECPKN